MLKTNKNLKLILFLALNTGFPAIFGMNNDKITESNNNLKITTKETMLHQDVCLYVFSKNEKPKNKESEIARIEYKLDDPSTIYIPHIGIHNLQHHGKGLGKKLLIHTVHHAKERNQSIKTICGNPEIQPLSLMSQNDLERWCKKLGCKEDKKASLFTFKLKNLKQSFIASNNVLSSFSVNESSLIDSSHTLELKDGNTVIAKSRYNLVATQEVCSVIIQEFSINPDSLYKKNELECLLKKEILKNISTKKWLKNRRFEVVWQKSKLNDTLIQSKL